MAIYRHLLVLVIVAVNLLQVVGSSPSALVVQVTASASSSSTPEFLLKIAVGTPSQTQLLRIDLSSDLTVLSCDGGSSTSNSFDPAKSSAFRYVDIKCVPSSCPPTAGIKLAEDRLTLNSTNGISPGTPTVLNQVILGCAAPSSSASPVAALSSSQWALPAQLAAQGHLARKFAYCLPSSLNHPAPLFFGSGVDYIFQSGPPVDVSAGLSFATLLINTQTHAYALGLQGVTVDGTLLRINPQELHISTTQPYTKLATSIYAPLRSAFATKAAARNLTAARAVAPFNTCFQSSSAVSTRLGPGVPEIDFQLQGNVTWQIFGLNSVVSVSDSVICFAFLDAGAGQPSTLGTFQQQDNLLQFDLEKSLLGFSGLLDGYRTVCSDFLF